MLWVGPQHLLPKQRGTEPFDNAHGAWGGHQLHVSLSDADSIRPAECDHAIDKRADEAGGLMAGKGRELIRALQSRLLRDCRGSELIELAITLPILLVMAVGLSQFSGAFNLSQIVNNAAREGARVAINEFSDSGTLNNCGSGSCVAAVAQTVSNYLTNAHVSPQCTFNKTGAASGKFTWTFTASGGGTCSLASLKVERSVPIVSAGTTVSSTRVTLTYPSPYTMGGVLSLLGRTLTMPTSLTSNAIMENIN
jgi:Flp pilus assembly protein TadG